MTPIRHCRSCNAPIYWCVTERGKMMPVDREPTESGEWTVEPSRDGEHLRVRRRVAGEAGRTSHFATCPTADKHRKVEHVRKAEQSRSHGCHWPGCERQVPPAMWGCRYHWFTLPKRLRDRVWAEYVPGQEDRMDPSDEYLSVAQEVQEWIMAERETTA